MCIIAPVSSWAVAVASEVSPTDGFHIFLSTIPYNFYALMTIVMVFFISFTGRDFGPMKKAEERMRAEGEKERKNEEQTEAKGKVIDLVLPADRYGDIHLPDLSAPPTCRYHCCRC